MKRWIFSCLVLCISSIGKAQAPRQMTGAAILQGIHRLNVLGSVLYLAAHPDDENTRLIACLANEKQYRTGYLSLTRGDGGQNLIGNEQGVALGLIRTQELLAARRIDGGEQFFTRAFDFGFSKNPEETFHIWNRNLVLSDVVWVIRKFQPDIIITRFPTTGEGGHGHHTASAILAREAFKMAADPNRFPEQLKYVQPWQAKRLLWNTFNFGGLNTTGPGQFKMDAGGFNAALGKSYGEIAALSRSQHKSQGFGSMATRGRNWEYFKTISGSAPVNELMDGIDLTWNRIGPEGKNIEAAVTKIENDFSVDHPAASISALVHLYQQISGLPDSYWKQEKKEEVQELIRQCGGLFIKAASRTQKVLQGSTVTVDASIINRSPGTVLLKSIELNGKTIPVNKKLEPDVDFTQSIVLNIPENAPLTQPYWLKEPMAPANYTVTDQQEIGNPDVTPAYTAVFNVSLNGTDLSFRQPVQYNFADPVKGELYEPMIIVPKATVQLSPKIVLFNRNKETTKSLRLDLLSTDLKPDQLSYGLTGLPENAAKAVADTGQGVLIPVSNRLLTKEVTTVSGFAQDKEGHRYDKTLQSIRYDHIPYVNYFFSDSVKLLNIDLKTAGKKIGYIPGAGDKVPEVLSAMGYEVVLLDRNRIATADLSALDAIISGVRAYNVNDWLNDAYGKLMTYVKNGGNLIVQYNTNNNIGPVKAKIGPYNFSISRNRITDEKAAVTFIDPKAAVLNYPNKITQKDFEGWVQERSTYHGADWDKELKPVLSMHDPGEPDNSGALLTGKYGKGYFTYSGIAFFRQLPAGVPGAIRLFANIIALNSQSTITTNDR
ncbi:GlcNAc-PI de-N-acetylase [Niabella ginsenosidivorans]|uniref:GlcNAc-PI de-N-acetylase n=1 Tax=Niabella ginsenosidivorans TaxID=1176587 RepID=A0A1A9I1Y3_9BACT|nr:PIG-L family deacetylase [Niabella ginsenosidivorans]ANH80720.1 GlcNAc-PI de-N-acetylase [Niabella ginsenosidivorans]